MTPRLSQNSRAAGRTIVSRQSLKWISVHRARVAAGFAMSIALRVAEFWQDQRGLPFAISASNTVLISRGSSKRRPPRWLWDAGELSSVVLASARVAVRQEG